MGTLEQVKQVVKALFKIQNIQGLDLDTQLFDIGLDSMNAIQLIIRLEETFGISIEDEELIFENFDSIRKIVTVVENKRGN